MPISYAPTSWNVVTGCTAVSAACENCWACRLAATRLKNLPDYRGLAHIDNHGRAQWTGEVRLHPGKLSEPLHWRKPRRIGVAFGGDLFHEAVPDTFIDQVFAVIALSSWHTFLILTKRPERMRDYIEAPPRPYAIREQVGPLVGRPPEIGLKVRWPLPNVWLGVTVENRESLWRIDALRETPAALRWLSFEPLLEDLGEVNLEGIGWAIVGSESGSNARSFNLDWARSIRDQCVAAGVKFYLKQAQAGYGPGRRFYIKHEPELDGRQWLQLP